MFCGWIQVGIDIYILHRKYQVKSHLSLWFPYLTKITSFICTKRNNLLDLKFWQSCNCCKEVLETVKLSYANKTKNLSLGRQLTLVTFGELLIMFSTKVNLQYVLCLKSRRGFLLHLIKQNCLLKRFLRTRILMPEVSFCLFSLLDSI